MMIKSVNANRIVLLFVFCVLCQKNCSVDSSEHGSIGEAVEDAEDNLARNVVGIHRSLAEIMTGQFPRLIIPGSSQFQICVFSVVRSVDNIMKSFQLYLKTVTMNHH